MEHEYIIVSSSATLMRNYTDLPFDAASNAATAGRVLSRTANALDGAGFTLHLLREMSADNRRALVEAGQIPAQLLAAEENAAVLLPVEGDACVAVGAQEHVCITARRRGAQLMQALEDAFRVEDRISGGATFAFDEQLGYVTAQHQRLGTGLEVSLTLHLPMLLRARRLPQIASSLKETGVQLRLHGNPPEHLIGDMVEIVNDPSLGLTEKEICHRVIAEAERLCAMEADMRHQAMQEHPLRLEDQACRALALLHGARLLGQKEFRRFWSDVRLGAAMGLLSLGVEQVDALMPQGLDAHLRNYAEEALEGEALDACRAARVQELLEENPLSSSTY